MLKGLRRLVRILFVLVLIMPLIFTGMIYAGLVQMHDSSFDSSLLRDLDYDGVQGIKNILLLGTDARPGEEKSRSDSMMILTMDSVHKSIKLTSLQRDSYVDVPGVGQTKLTHAYYYGGPELLIDTIEKNFMLDINDYAIVNFDSFMDIIDAIGGVEVDVKANELDEANKFINETYNWAKNKNPNIGEIQYLQSPGLQKLNGYQTLSFSRIRKNDNAYQRDRRQRDVMSALMKGIKEAPKYRYISLFKAVLPYVKTNMSPGQIVSYGLKILTIGDTDIKQMEFPIPLAQYSTGGIYGNAGWVLRFTPESIDVLHNFIFNDIEFNLGQ